MRSGRRPITPGILLAALPIARIVFFVSFGLMVVFNVGVLFSRDYRPAWLAKWLDWSNVFINEIADWNLGAIRLAKNLTQIGLTSRIEVTVNVAVVDWALYIVGLVLVILAAVFDVACDNNSARKMLWQRVEATGRALTTVQWVYFVFSVLAVAFAFTGEIYFHPVPVYDQDIGFFIALVWFYYALAVPACFAALCVLRCFREPARL
jgi:hypothetical protein